MPKIKLLPPEIIAKIAAGEVIERPVYAIKELIDNAIDAQATKIEIQLEKSGLQKIQCIDNGIGMSKEDLRTAFLAHSTSKISSESDLFAIHTLGFRGEALWSIAAISDLTIKSRERNTTEGYEIELHDNQIQKLQPVGMPEGTEVIIQNLFYNTPARKKFLHSPQTELRLINELVGCYALAYPEIIFSLKHEKRTLLDTAKNQDRLQRISLLHGTQTTEYLLPVNGENEYLQLSGFIAKPQAALTNAAKQFIFVNNRRIFDRTIASLVKESFGTLLEPKLYPVFFLFLDIPPERMDINIHPRKEQVVFSEPQLVTQIIKSTVEKAITDNDLKYYDMRWQKSANPDSFVLHDGGTATYTAKTLKATTTPWSVKSSLNDQDQQHIEQFHNLYIIIQTASGILLIDQHAAHERILYEQFLHSFQDLKQKKEVIKLEKPFDLELPSTEQLLLEEYAEQLEQIGFQFNKSNSVWSLQQIPSIYKDRNYRQLISEALHDLSEDNSIKSVDTASHKLLSYLACRSAIKAGERLTKEEMQNLYQKLQQTTTQYTCPHGRPVQVELSLNQLHKLFHRI